MIFCQLIPSSLRPVKIIVLNNFFFFLLVSERATARVVCVRAWLKMSNGIRRCSFQEETTICVVLVPVWSDDTMFARIAKLLHRFDTVNLQEIHRSGSPWVKGTVRIRYVDYVLNRIDTAWDVFQGYRNVLGVGSILTRSVFFFQRFSFTLFFLCVLQSCKGHWYRRL